MIKFKHDKSLNGHTQAAWVLSPVKSTIYKYDFSLISGSCDGTIKCWNISDGKCTNTLHSSSSTKKEKKEVYALATSCDDKYAISGSNGSVIKIWDLKDFSCQKEIKEHKAGISYILTLPNNNFVSQAMDSTIRLWSMDGDCKRVITEGSDYISTVIVLANNENIVSESSKRTIGMWSLNSGKVVSTFHGHNNEHMRAFVTASTNTFLSGSNGFDIKLWDIRKKEEVRTFLGHENYVNALSMFSDDTFVSASGDGNLKIWDINSGKCLATTPPIHKKWIQAVQVMSFDNNKIIVSGSGDNTIGLWSLEQSSELNKINTEVDEKKSLSSSVKILDFSQSKRDNKNEEKEFGKPNKNLEKISKVTKKNKDTFKTKSDKNLKISIPYITYSELKLNTQDPLGEGSYGVVYQGTWFGADIVLKQLKNQKLDEEAKKLFIKEAKVTGKVGFHPNIVRVNGICVEEKHCGLVMELMPQGSLYGLLQNNKKDLPWKVRFSIIMDISYGLEYLHSKGVWHRDLKSPNILLNNDLRAKLTDFGLARVDNSTNDANSSVFSLKQEFTGSIRWMAPELFEDDPKFTKESDVYSYGMVVWEVVSREIPWKSTPSMAIGIKLVAKERETIPKKCPLSLATLITGCWRERTKRLDIEQAVKELEKNKDNICSYT